MLSLNWTPFITNFKTFEKQSEQSTKHQETVGKFDFDNISRPRNTKKHVSMRHVVHKANVVYVL